MIKEFKNIKRKITKKDVVNLFGRELKTNQYKKARFSIEHKKRITCICDKCGKEYGRKWVSLKKNINKTLCRSCLQGKRNHTNRRVLTLEKFIKRAKRVHGSKYDYSKVIYKPGNIKIKIICKTHGIFVQNPHNHLFGQGCPLCGRNITHNHNKKWLSKKDFIKKARKVFGKKYDYSKLDSRIHRTQKVIIICKKHGEYKQIAAKHLKGKNCRKCARDAIGLKLRQSQKDFIEKSKKIHGNKYDYSKVRYIKNSIKVRIICKTHGDFWQRPFMHTQGNGCPSCKKSIGENRIENWLKINKIKYERQKYFKKCKDKRYLLFDFYLSKYRTCIEYDGPHHFKSVNYFDNNEFIGIKRRDKIKEKFCKNNNINLIRIPHTSLKNIENILKRLIQLP